MIIPAQDIPGHHKHFYLIRRIHIQGQRYLKHLLLEIKIEKPLRAPVFS